MRLCGQLDGCFGARSVNSRGRRTRLEPLMNNSGQRERVNLAFFRGAELDDPERLLEGTGKGMRHVTVKSVGDINEDAVGTLVRAADLSGRD